MQIFKSKDFTKWAKKQKINNTHLLNAINEINKGLYEASLGGNLYKKRIACKGQGKRKSVRTILALQIEKKAFFIYGFSKNEKDNITGKEEETLKLLASFYLNLHDNEIKAAINIGDLIEVIKNEEINT